MPPKDCFISNCIKLLSKDPSPFRPLFTRKTEIFLGRKRVHFIGSWIEEKTCRVEQQRQNEEQLLIFSYFLWDFGSLFSGRQKFRVQLRVVEALFEQVGDGGSGNAAEVALRYFGFRIFEKVVNRWRRVDAGPCEAERVGLFGFRAASASNEEFSFLKAWTVFTLESFFSLILSRYFPSILWTLKSGTKLSKWLLFSHTRTSSFVQSARRL